MQATFNISEKDYVNASQLFAKLTPKMMLIYVAVLVMLIVAIILGSPVLKGAAIGGLIGGVAMMLVGRFIISPILVKRHYRQYKAIHDEFTLQLLDEGVRFISSTGESMLPWDTILKWRHNDDYILIYPMPRLYHIVPKSISASGFDMPLLLDQLHRHIGKSV